MDYAEEDTTIDAVRFVALTEGLHAAFARVAAAKLERRQRERWHRRLAAISDTAQRDLGGAQAELHRYHEDWSREVRD